MKKKSITWLLLCFLSTCLYADDVIPLMRHGDVYSFTSYLNGKAVATVVSSHSRVFIPFDVVLSLYDEKLLNDSDFLGFTEYNFRPENIRPGVAINIRQVVIGSKKLENVVAYITGSMSPFFSLGQIELNELGSVTFEDGKLIIADSIPDQISDPIKEKEIIELPENVSPRDTMALRDSATVTMETLYIAGMGYFEKGHYSDALSFFKDAEKWLSGGESVDFVCSLYKALAQTYAKLGKPRDQIRYLRKAIALSDGKECVEMQQVLVDYYKGQKDVSLYEKEALLYLKSYCSWKKIDLSDCWKSKRSDPVIGNLLYDLAERFESNNDFRKFYTYYYYSAAWGNEGARQYCRNASVAYWNMPVNKIVL